MDQYVLWATELEIMAALGAATLLASAVQTISILHLVYVHINPPLS